MIHIINSYLRKALVYHVPVNDTQLIRVSCFRLSVPHTDQVIPKKARKFDNNTSIFEVDGQYDKQYGHDYEVYPLSIYTVRNIDIGMIEDEVL